MSKNGNLSVVDAAPDARVHVERDGLSVPEREIVTSQGRRSVSVPLIAAAIGLLGLGLLMANAGRNDLT